jgi:hypothetical protein
MSTVRRLVALVLLLSVAVTGTALASRGEPQRNINAADQARAKAMLARRSDLGYGTRAVPSGSGDSDAYCKALDESDLTITGEARTPTFVSGLVTLNVESNVYKSVRNANASWRRGTSNAGTTCIRGIIRAEFAKGGLRLISLRQVPFPTVAQRTVAYRIAFSGQSQGLTVRAYIDYVVLQQGRAQLVLLFGSAIDPLEKPEQIRIARTVGTRMVKAMRGA